MLKTLKLFSVFSTGAIIGMLIEAFFIVFINVAQATVHFAAQVL